MPHSATPKKKTKKNTNPKTDRILCFQPIICWENLGVATNFIMFMLTFAAKSSRIHEPTPWPDMAHSVSVSPSNAFVHADEVDCQLLAVQLLICRLDCLS